MSYFSNIIIFFLIFINFAHAENLLKIGISDDNSYPYYFKQAARFQGLEVDLIKEIAHELNLQIQINAFPFKELANELKKNNIDLIISMVSETPERKAKYALSNPYICTYGTFLFRNEKAKLDFSRTNRKNRTPLTIGVYNGTRYHKYAVSIAENKNLKVQAFSSHDLAMGAFDAKKLDIVLSEYFLMKDHQSRHRAASYVMGDNAFVEKLVIMTSKNNQNLIDKINLVLKKMHFDGRLASLSQKYLKTNLLCN